MVETHAGVIDDDGNIPFRLADGTPTSSSEICGRLVHSAEAGKNAASHAAPALLKTQEQIEAVTQAFGMLLSRRHISFGQLRTRFQA